MKKLLCMLVGTALLYFSGFSQERSMSPSVMGYVENIGQITDQDGQPNADVLFLFAAGQGMNLQLRTTGFSYDLYNHAEGAIHMHRVDVTFKGARQDFTVKSAQKMNARMSYYLAGDHAMAGSAGVFEEVRYENVYDNIDFVFKKDASGQMKYDIILHPGAQLSDIQLYYEGTQGVEIIEGQLQLKNTVRPLKEVIPVSFYADNGESLAVVFNTESDDRGHTITYSTQAPDLFTREFVIDPVPEFVWGKYVGDSLNTEVRGVITDRFGDVYICGMTQSLNNIATAGAYQDTITDSIGDAFLSKYSKFGVLQWSTYFGGPESDIANDVYVDTSFNIVLAGTTFSPVGIADSLGHQDTLGGNADAFLARFNKDGLLHWATYFGGDSLDVGMKLSTDYQHNIYLSGLTKSDTAIATDSAFQLNLMGDIDGFVAKFDSSGVLQWSSYHGGSGYDAATGVAFGDTSVYISGVTFSSDLNVTDSVYQDSLLGLSDGFIARISPDGTLIWSSYFGGEKDDNMRNVKVFNNNIYFTGTTASDTNIASVGSFQSVRGDSLFTDAFIGKMDRHGNLLWSSYYGGDSTDIGVDLFFELDSNIIAYGTSYSANLPFTDSSSYQENNAGGADTYMTKVAQNGSILWSTYYGGPGDDFAEAVDVYGNTAIYVVGSTYSDTVIIPSGHISGTNVFNSVQEGFLSKFRQSISTGAGGIGGNGTMSGLIYICPGEEVMLSTIGGELGTDADWVWYEGQCGNTQSIGQGDSIIVAPLTSTTYYVRAESITNASECASVTVMVHNVTPILITSDSVLCEGSDYTLEASGSGTIDWTGPNNFSSTLFQNEFLNVTDSIEGWYFLEATDTVGCTYEDSIELQVATPPSATLTTVDATCFGYNDGSVSAQVSDTTGLMYTLEQLFTPYDTLSGLQALDSLSAGSYMFTITDSNSCQFVELVEIFEPDSMLINATVYPTSCSSATGSVILEVDTTLFNVTVEWSPSGQTGLTADSLDYGTHEVVITNQFGCEESYSFFIDNENHLSLTFDYVQHVTCPNDPTGTATAIPVNGVAPYTFDWVETGDTVDMVDSLTAGDYLVYVYDADGCMSYDTLTIESAFDLDISVQTGTSLCSTPTGFINVVVSPQGGVNIVFNTGDTTFYVDSLSSGVYTATVTDSNGCVYPVTTEVELLNDLDVWTTPGDTLIEIATTESLQAVTNATFGTYYYTWSPAGDLSCTDCPNPDITPMNPETYTVVVTDSNGCVDSATVFIDIFVPCIEVFLPSMFSPNGDGLNDSWRVIGSCIDRVSMAIYDQWGELLFQSFSQEEPWNGMYQGSIVPNDQYVYVVEVTYDDGTTESFSGFVSVVN